MPIVPRNFMRLASFLKIATNNVITSIVKSDNAKEKTEFCHFIKSEFKKFNETMLTQRNTIYCIAIIIKEFLPQFLRKERRLISSTLENKPTKNNTPQKAASMQ